MLQLFIKSVSVYVSPLTAHVGANCHHPPTQADAEMGELTEGIGRIMLRVKQLLNIHLQLKRTKILKLFKNLENDFC